MGTPIGRADRPLIQTLREEPWRFEFVQAVRILERLAEELSGQADRHSTDPLGLDRNPSTEPIRFGASPAISFPSAPITEVRPRPQEDGAPSEPLVRMIVTFMGLTGPTGVLPNHYTALVIERLREKDPALRDFLDLFNHRLITLFHRASQKYRFPLNYEQARNDPDQTDAFTTALFNVIGMGTGHLRNRLDIQDEAMLFYGGHFAHFPRCAISLQQMLSDYFKLPAQIRQFQGQWLYLTPGDRSRMPDRASRKGLNNSLGRDIVLGERVWDVQSKFRIILGPLSYADYCRFLPDGGDFKALGQMVRLYARMEFDFDVQSVLRADEVPACALGAPRVPQRLGRNLWLKSEAMRRDFTGAVFEPAA